MTRYGCGLRLSVVLALRVRDIGSERRLLRITQGKGAQDRLVPLSPTLLVEIGVGIGRTRRDAATSPLGLSHRRPGRLRSGVRPVRRLPLPLSRLP